MTKLNIDIQNTYINKKVDEKDLIQAAKQIFQHYMKCSEIAQNCCLNEYKYNTISFDILFCDSKQTHSINKEYRGKDYPADIITFAVFADSVQEERFVLDLEINLGEIIIALDKIEQQAKEKGIDFDSELKFFISHGIMHLLGFDHQSEKEFDFVIKHQKSALETIGIKYDKI